MINLAQPLPRLFIIMGVGGTGKSSLAKQMAHELELVFIDADDFHSEQAKKHMKNNRPLTDEMRKPWLVAIIKHLSQVSLQGKSVVLAYSGLKSAHRELFRELSFYCHFFYLIGDRNIIANRITLRKTHFFKKSLLDSQFEAMEPPLLSELDVSLINIDRPFLLVAKKVNNLAKIITREVNRT